MRPMRLARWVRELASRVTPQGVPLDLQARDWMAPVLPWPLLTLGVCLVSSGCWPLRDPVISGPRVPAPISPSLSGGSAWGCSLAHNICVGGVTSVRPLTAEHVTERRHPRDSRPLSWLFQDPPSGASEGFLPTKSPTSLFISFLFPLPVATVFHLNSYYWWLMLIYHVNTNGQGVCRKIHCVSWL